MMVEPIELANVADHLRLGRRSLVAFVGGGGKTTTMFAVGAALQNLVMTTTTKMAADSSGGFETVIGASADEIANRAAASPVLAWRTIDSAKAIGYQPEFCDRLSERIDHVLVEADGARRMPLTAPGPGEPAVPSLATHVVAVIGADALGRCIGDQCHRPMRVAAIAGCRPYDRLTPERAARMLLSDRGLRKNVPATARYVVTITKVTDPVDPAVSELIDRLGKTTVIPILKTTDTP